MPLDFTTTDAATLENGVKIMAYGPAGMGKTVLCATMPEPIILSAESGLLSLTKANQLRLFGVHKDIPVIQIRTVDDFNEAYQFCTESEHAKRFKSICLDSISEIAEQILSNALKQVKDPRQAYGELLEKTMMALKAFRDISGFHVYCSAKQEMKADENGRSTYYPGMPGSKLGQNIAYLFDEVFHMGVGITEDKTQYRYLQTQPDLQHIAKDRSGALDAMEQPNLSVLIDKILSHV